MKLVHVALVVALACCGDEIIESSRDSGSDGHGGSAGSAGAGGTGGSGSSGAGGSAGSGGSAGAAGSPNDSGLPEVGSTACVRFDGTCVLCNDDKWHCADLVFPQCPSGVEFESSCPDSDDSGSCIDCESDGAAAEWQCGSNGNWSMLVRNSCSQEATETSDCGGVNNGFDGTCPPP
jgi:hypothetical protein